MSNAQRSDTGRPVSRLVSPLLLRLAAILALAVAICVIGVLVSSQSVGALSDDLEPTSRSHDEVSARLGEVQSATAAWTAGGDPAALTAYAAAESALESAMRDLRERAAGDGELVAVVEPELAAAEAYLDGYAAVVVAAPGGAGQFDITLFTAGQRLWAEYQMAHEVTHATLRQHSLQAGDSATVRFRLTILAALLVLLASWVLIGRLRTRLLAQLSAPLQSLELVVQRMLRNDPDGRADAQRGPSEVRAVARALNDLADAQTRARAVEGRIQDELHVLDSAKDDFVSNVSHELRTPLTTISGYLEMIADEFEGRLEPRHDRMLEATRRNVLRLRVLIDDLLALSRAETRPNDVEPYDVTEMLTEAVTDVRMAGSRRGIQVELNAPSVPLAVSCDRAMLYRAFLNLLTNAVKFSHDGGSVEVDVTRVADRVQVAVRDHGIGIPVDELDRLGTRFFRASNARDNEIAGTGLGLRIVQTIIDKHAGDVVIESAEGEGTTVFVRLRLVLDAPEFAGTGARSLSSSTGSGSRRAPRADPGYFERTS